MRYDLIASFFREADDKEPVYSCPLGIFSETNAYDSWDLKEWGFKEDPDSTPGYLDYINRDFHKDDLQFITKGGYVSEVMDVLHCGEDFGRIDVYAREIDTIDDNGTLPPLGFFITDTFVEFGQTEPLSPVWFIDGDPYRADENTRRFCVPLKKLKDYFEVLTMYEVREHLQEYFAKGHPWTFEELKEYFEAGIDDAVDLATRTFFGLRDLDGNPQILHALAVGMAGETKNEKIVGFLHDVVEDSPTTLEDLKVYGYSDEVVEAVGLLTHDKNAISYDDYIANIGFSGNDLAIKVKIRDLKHNIERGKAGRHRTLVKKHEDALAALLDYKEGRCHVLKDEPK
jgi:hypothetical protein